MQTIDIDFLELAWGDRGEPYHEVASQPSSRFVGDFNGVAAKIEDGDQRFFAPMPRITLGSSKEDVARTGNLLWLDTDTPGGLERIGSLKNLGLNPSAIIDTGGRGHHAYFKLSRDLPVAQVEGYNRLLASTVDADRGIFNRSRLMRLPGFPHTKTGKPCRVISLDGTIHDPEDLTVLGEPKRARPRLDLARLHEPEPTADPVFLSFPLRRYLKDETALGKYDSRSEAEAALVVWYLLAGWSDDQIVAKALSDGWHKTIEEACRTPGNPERWIRRTISNERDWLLFEHERRLLTWPEGGKPKRAKQMLKDYDWLERVPPGGKTRQEYEQALASVLPGRKPKRDAGRLFARMEREGMVSVLDGRVASALAPASQED